MKEKIGLADAGDFARTLGYDYQWENIGDAYTQGVELSTRFLVMKDLLLDLYGTYTDAEYDDERSDWVESHPEFAQDSKYISRVPELTAGSKLDWSPGNWDFVLDGNWTGRMYIDYYEDDDIENPGSEIVHTAPFWVWNTRLSYNFTEIGLELFAGVKNLFNKVQSDRRPDDAAFIYAPLTGRLAYAGGKFTF